MKKINLKGISEILNEKEMKNVVGGGTFKQNILEAPEAGGGGSSPKIDACVGKKLCDGCSFKYNGNTSYGRCSIVAPTYTLYCSDASGCH